MSQVSGFKSLTPRPSLLALSSALLLTFAFPNFNQPWCAWFALVPWLLLLRSCSLRQAFWWSCHIGMLFFLCSIWWLVHVTLVGLVLLSGLMALYFGLFGAMASTILRQETRDRRQETGNTGHGTRFWFLVSGRWSDVRCLVYIPAAWVALEYARSHLFSGFGWNLLAYSQSSVLPVIQFADLTGVWGVSALIVAVNVMLTHVISEFLRSRQHVTRDTRQVRVQHSMRSTLLLVTCTVSLVAAVWAYGVWRLPQVVGSETIRVAVVQGNIPQAEKWDEAYQDRNLTRYETLTQEAARTGPQLIVWPETSATGFLGIEPSLTKRLITLAGAVQLPMLVGAPTGRRDGAVLQTLNSAVLLDPRGIRRTHAKLHLVPYGEFIPFERWMPWLRQILPPIGEFVPGNDVTVFRHMAVPPFSVLVCFEDIFPDLARRFIREGAQWLLVITNDAWFGPTAAAYQHAQASTFRAVELRVPIARAANTGWSGCIDASGRWLGAVRDASGAELFVAGTYTCDLPVGPAESLYRRWGDWFALLCLLLTAATFGLGMVRARNS